MEQIILSTTVLEFTWLVIDGFVEENNPGYTAAKNINDVIATDHGFEECIFTVVETIYLFQKLAFVIHPDKSKFVPAKIVEYLGWLRKMVTFQIFKKLKSEMVTRSEKKSMRIVVSFSTILKQMIRQFSSFIDSPTSTFPRDHFGPLCYTVISKFNSLKYKVKLSKI